MNKPMETIKAVFGAEPRREGEYPTMWVVSQEYEGRTITHILFREDNYGDHGLGWFDIFSGEIRLASMSARETTEVHYQFPTQ